jgi:hypothetical protein
VSFVALSYAVSVLYLPVLMRFVLGALRGLSSGPAHAAFWDATGFLTVTLGSLRTLIGVSIRDVRRRRRETRSTRGMRSYG